MFIGLTFYVHYVLSSTVSDWSIPVNFVCNIAQSLWTDTHMFGLNIVCVDENKYLVSHFIYLVLFIKSADTYQRFPCSYYVPHSCHGLKRYLALNAN